MTVSRSPCLAALALLFACGGGGESVRETPEPQPTASIAATGADGGTAAPVTTAPPAPAALPPGPLVTRRQGSLLTIDPIGLSFDMPPEWTRWWASSHNNVHLTRAELDAVHEGAGDWDTQYAAVVNAVFPFDRCAVHAGGEGWGEHAVAYSDVQLRVYVLAEAPEAIEARFRAQGAPPLAAAARTAVQTATDAYGPWRKTSLTAMLMFGDYGGEATVDIRLKPIAGGTVAFVFMYSNFRPEEDFVRGILDSVRG